MEKNKYRGYRDLKTYQLAYALALEIHEIMKILTAEERYSLVDQIGDRHHDKRKFRTYM